MMNSSLRVDICLILFYFFVSAPVKTKDAICNPVVTSVFLSVCNKPRPLTSKAIISLGQADTKLPSDWYLVFDETGELSQRDICGNSTINIVLSIIWIVILAKWSSCVMHPIVISDPIAWCVSLSHAAVLYKYGWTDQDPVYFWGS